jgi:hypothetical protein
MCFLIDLLRNIVQLRDRFRAEHMGEIVDIIRRMELRDRLAAKERRSEQYECEEDSYPPHRGNCTGVIRKGFYRRER